MIRPLSLFLLSALPPAMVVCAAAVSAHAEAQARTVDSRLERAFGSTIVSTYPDGRQAELWLKRDGSYTAEGRRHDRSSGTWQIKDDKGAAKLCMKQRKPFPAPFSFCTGVPDGGLDKPWTGKAYTGEQTRIELVKGVYDPAQQGATAAGVSKSRASRSEAEHANDEG